MNANDIAIRPAKCQVMLNDRTVIQYRELAKKSNSHSVRRATTHVLRAASNATILPSEFLEVDAPFADTEEAIFAVEPRADTKSTENHRSFRVSLVSFESPMKARKRYVYIGTSTSDKYHTFSSQLFCQKMK